MCKYILSIVVEITTRPVLLSTMYVHIVRISFCCRVSLGSHVQEGKKCGMTMQSSVTAVGFAGYIWPKLGKKITIGCLLFSLWPVHILSLHFNKLGIRVFKNYCIEFFSSSHNTAWISWEAGLGFQHLMTHSYLDQIVFDTFFSVFNE